MRKFTQKEHLKFHKLAVSLFNKNESDIKHELAEYEMKHGEDSRKEVEFELNLLRREEQYKKEAQIFYDIVSNIGKYPEDYGHFPRIKKEIFKQYNIKKQRALERGRKKAKKNEKLIEELLLYRIKHMPTRFNPHLMPEGIKGVNAEVTMEAERMYYIYKSMLKHHEKHPTSVRFGLSKEERDILQKVRTGYFEKKIEGMETKKIKAKRKKKSIRTIIKSLTGEEKKEVAKEYSKKVWYRKSALKPQVVDVLKKIGYQENDLNRKVYDFNNRLVDCIAYKREGFRDSRYKDDKRETLHHFSKPFLLKELSPSTQVLVRVPSLESEDRTVDAVITYSENNAEKRVAVEFQESHKLGPQKVIDKLKPLLDVFDQVIVVCENAYKHVYDHYKHEKLKVVNNYEFQLLLKDWELIEEPKESLSTEKK